MRPCPHTQTHCSKDGNESLGRTNLTLTLAERKPKRCFGFDRVSALWPDSCASVAAPLTRTTLTRRAKNRAAPATPQSWPKPTEKKKHDAESPRFHSRTHAPLRPRTFNIRQLSQANNRIINLILGKKSDETFKVRTLKN